MIIVKLFFFPKSPGQTLSSPPLRSWENSSTQLKKSFRVFQPESIHIFTPRLYHTYLWYGWNWSFLPQDGSPNIWTQHWVQHNSCCALFGFDLSSDKFCLDSFDILCASSFRRSRSYLFYHHWRIQIGLYHSQTFPPVWICNYQFHLLSSKVLPCWV